MQYLDGLSSFRSDRSAMGKVLWGSLCLLSTVCIPLVGNIVIMGWSAMAIRHAALGRGTATLPRLELDANYLIRLTGAGFRVFLGALLAAVPAILVGFALLVGVVFVSASVQNTSEGLPVLFFVLLGLLSFGVLLPLLFFMQVAMLRVELSDRIGAALEVGPILHFIKTVPLSVVGGTMLSAIVSMLLGIAGVLACFIGVFPAQFIGTLVQALARCTMYERYLQAGGTPWEVVAPVDGAYEGAAVDAHVFV